MQEAVFDCSKGNRESADALQSIDASTLRDLVLQFIRLRGVKGATCDEIEIRLNLRHQIASARVTELKKMDKLVGIGRRATRSGRMAAVMCVKECA
jgi:hypothetical protein